MALLLAAAAFKDELKNVHLIFPPFSLLTIFITVTIFFAILLVLYLILDLTDGTFIEGKFNTQRFQSILDHTFLLSMIILVLFSLASFLIYLLNLSLGLSGLTVSSGLVIAIMLFMRITFDKHQYKKYLASLNEDARWIKMEILKTENYLATINDKDLRKNIQRDIDGLQREFDKVRVKQPLHPPKP